MLLNVNKKMLYVRARKKVFMKKVIDGKMYNTETAEKVYCWDNGRYGNDFRYRSKDLYKTKKGNWFIYHEGGAMTDMAISCGSNNYSGSENIEVVSEKDAFAFLTSHGGTEEAEKYFSEMIEEG
jgi:hypothetical protein